MSGHGWPGPIFLTGLSFALSKRGQINLGAGLDARPYRMQLPAFLQWVEVDLPEIIAYKEAILANEEPRCRLERICLDLSDAEARRTLLAELDRRAKKIVVMSEGLLIYLSTEEVGSLAKDLADGAHFGVGAGCELHFGKRRYSQQRSAVQAAAKTFCQG